MKLFYYNKYLIVYIYRCAGAEAADGRVHLARDRVARRAARARAAAPPATQDTREFAIRYCL